MKLNFFVAAIFLGLLILPAFGYLNGRNETGFPSAVEFFVHTPGLGRGRCQGVFVATSPTHDFLATANHCLGGSDQSVLEITQGGKLGARSNGLFPINRVHERDTDFALALFPSGTAHGISPIATTPVRLGASITSVAWQQQNKVSGDNQVFTYNWSRSGTIQTGYILNDGTQGGLPDQRGESGSGLFSNGHLIGVLKGCDSDAKDSNGNIVVPGWGCSFSAIHSSLVLPLVQQVHERFNNLFGALDPNRWSTLNDLNQTQAILQNQAPPPSVPTTTPTALPQPRTSQPPLVAGNSVPSNLAQTQSPQQNLVTAWKRAPVAVAGPEIPSLDPLSYLTQSPRENPVDPNSLPKTAQPERKMPELEPIAQPRWIAELEYAASTRHRQVRTPRENTQTPIAVNPQKNLGNETESQQTLNGNHSTPKNVRFSDDIGNNLK